MKNLILLLAVLPALALAGDDQVGSFTASASSTCINVGLKQQSAIQCDTDVIVVVSDSTTVGGTTAVYPPTASYGVKVPSGKMYDAPTSGTQTVVCAIQQTAGGACRVYINRSKSQ